MFQSRLNVIFAAALLQAVFWAGVLFVDPFGMSSSADRASEKIFLKLYPVIYPNDARDKIQVVLIDDEQLPLNAGGSPEWPLRFDEHIALIQKILELNPKGIFVDVLFDTKRGRVPEEFEVFLARLPLSAPPIVFAAYDKRDGQLIEPLQNLPFERRPDTAPGLRGLVELTGPENHYELVGEGGQLSAAGALYTATLLTLNQAPDAKSTPYAALDASQSAQMLVAWGTSLPAEAARSKDCAPIGDDADSRWQGFLQAIRAGFEGAINIADKSMPGSSWERLQPCAYHRAIAARSLFENTGEAVLAREAIAGSYVLIGGAVAGTNDTVVSPVHGQLPGVFFHAMALDNLLAYRGAHLTIGDWDWAVQFLLIFLCAFVGGLVFANSAPPVTRAQAVRHLSVRLAAWFGFAVVVASFLLVFLIEFKWAPYNWGSVLAVAGVVFFADSGKALLTIVRGPVSEE